MEEKINRKKKNGEFGEDAAANYLKENGFSIIERNYHCSHYETDIIAEDEKYIIFVEVKARSVGQDCYSKYGRPSAAVTKAKQKRLLEAARDYLRHHAVNKQPRLDVIEVFIDRKSEPYAPKIIKINHIRNAFGA